jgi:hypothetical protein
MLMSFNVGRDSSVGIVTRCGLDSPGSNAGGGEIFRTLPTDPVAHQASCAVGTEPFPGVKRPGVASTTYPIYRRGSRKSIAVPLLPLCVLMAGYMANFYLFHLSGVV